MIKEALAHAHFTHAEILLQDSLTRHAPGRLVGIVGMPGSGKTFLRNLVVRRIIGSPESWGTGKVHVTEVMALLDINAKFSAKGFAARAHRSVLCPDLRSLYREATDEISEAYMRSLRDADTAWRKGSAASNTSESRYWAAFTEAAIGRDLKLLLVEHAAAIGKAQRGEEPKDHIWNLMSILDQVGCMGILNLIPEGFALWDGRPEIAERMDRIYIKPYDLRDREQLTEFARIVLHVAEKYEWESENAVQDRIVDIGIATATGMRALQELFARADINAKRRGSGRICGKDIEDAYETETHIANLWRQVDLLNRISKPATNGALRDIHRDFVEAEL
ncbi:hypothetical protein ACFONC_09120 [Luteimonas soli]|uniref:ATP-binding protein n=1 Tax=Luteimonas soli TaxID=1648966 RepID=A0ABV7XKL0_9GAMM